ncbi:MAG: hypothetical protein Q7U54_10025 [Bacteroidales bacterium]|nr:hypothetical protein [Bacteroidales bacterium]
MNANQLLDDILAMLRQVKDSKEDLQKIHDFMSENIFVEAEEEVLVIPEKHKKAVAEIADNIQCGFICQVNKKTVEIVSIRRENIYESEYYEEEEEDLAENTNWEDIITISPPESHESFRIMENYVLSLDQSRLKYQLTSALQRGKPFANFNGIIHNSPERDEWFRYRQHALEQHVAAILMAESAW